MNPIKEKQEQIEIKNHEIQDWHSLLRNTAWQKLVQFLKDEYCDVKEEDYTSLRKLSALQAKRKLIKQIFNMINYDYSERQILEEELSILIRDEEDIPTKDIPYL